MLRAVVDPGVLIAALLSPRGAPAGLLLAWLDGRFHLIVSPSLLEELERVLLRPKFRRYVAEEEAQAFVALLRNFGTLFPDPDVTPGLTPDPGDDYLVALAQTSGADLLVSSDPHLSALRRVRPPIVTPRVFLDRVAAE